ncbi:uncharacterized protein LOC132731814 [Ruditapes philippinarum]|uniref:uncharacterized protein LOC132731814 n=1 Tax=Ruditapes philippinarum TaxID=129788 RepID=UPI00295AED7E|nr:uncharacterized protein LOC132731814 [Ruditapes philippinarum]
MSSSLVKQSLSLFEDDLIREPTQKKKTKDPMSLISTKKKGVRKELRKLQTQKQRISAAKRSSHLPINVSQVPEIHDYTDSSIKILTRLSQLDSSSKNTAKSISEHHRKKKRRKTTASKETKAVEEKSAFSDKDFEAFAKDFDFGKLKKK